MLWGVATPDPKSTHTVCYAVLWTIGMVVPTVKVLHSTTLEPGGPRGVCDQHAHCFQSRSEGVGKGLILLDRSNFSPTSFRPALPEGVPGYAPVLAHTPLRGVDRP